MVANYNFTDRFSAAGRSEFFNDFSGARTGVSQRLWEATVDLKYLITQHLYVQGEFRGDVSNQKPFQMNTTGFAGDNEVGNVYSSNMTKYVLALTIVAIARNRLRLSRGERATPQPLLPSTQVIRGVAAVPREILACVSTIAGGSVMSVRRKGMRSALVAVVAAALSAQVALAAPKELTAQLRAAACCATNCGSGLA